MPFRVVIVGGGLAGNLLANGLIRENIDVQVYERYERHSTRDGLQIRLTAPALAGLRTCLTEQHLLSIIKKFGPASDAKAEAPRVFHKDWSLLLDLSRFPAYGKNAPINRGVLRDCLADPVFDAGKLKYETAFDRFEVLNPGTDTEKIRVWLSDGTYSDCDLLVGADGSYSKINDQIGLKSIHPIKRHYAITAKCDLPTERFLKMPKELFGGPIMTWADEMSFFFGVYLPGKYDKDGNRLDSKAGDQKLYDKSLSSCMISLNVDERLLPPDLTEQSLDAQYDFMRHCVREWSDRFLEIIELMRGAPLHIYKPRVAKRPPRNWRKRLQKQGQKTGQPELGHPRVWLMGDAIHAMLPPRGMGGNMAMYDATQILPLLVDFARKDKPEKRVSRLEIERALSQYEDEMIPRSFAWVKKSGGDNFVPLNTSTIFGRLFFFIAGQWLNIVCMWTNIRQAFSNSPPVDETPEFNLY